MIRRPLLLAITAALLAAACAESTATATNESDGWDADRTVSPELVRAAEARPGPRSR